MKTSVLNLANLIQGFKMSCQTEGKSPKTTEWYTSFLERFRRFLEQSGLPASKIRPERTFSEAVSVTFSTTSPINDTTILYLVSDNCTILSI